MNKKKIITSLAFNAAIFVVTIIGLILAIVDLAQDNKEYWLVFVYFTTWSSMFLCISSILRLIYESLFLAGKINEIPNWVNIIRLCGVTSTALTLFTVLFYLIPTATLWEKRTVAFLFTGSNLWFNLINPLLGIVSFICFQNTKKIKLPQVCFTMIFTAYYAYLYILNVYANQLGLHDWYNFLYIVNNTEELLVVVALVFIGISFFLGWILWLCNRKIRIWEVKEQKQQKKVKSANN